MTLPLALVLLLLSLSIAGASSSSSGSAAKALPLHATLTQLQQRNQDFDILREAIFALHPGLYRYNSRQQIDQSFIELHSDFDKTTNLQREFVCLSEFLTKIRCGHTYTNFLNQPDGTKETLFSGDDRVPFFFRWIDEEMIVTKNLSSDINLSVGSQVLAINDVPTRKILDTLLLVSRADGSNVGKRISGLEVTGAEEYEAFDIYYPMLFPVPNRMFVLTIRHGQSKTQLIRVAALSDKQRLSYFESAEGDLKADHPFWTFRMLDSRTGYLRMQTWSVYDTLWDWKAFLDDTFSTLEAARIPNLIIDIRGNEGGDDDVGTDLLGRLTSKIIAGTGQFDTWTMYRSVPPDIRPYLQTWDPSFYDWGDEAEGAKDGFYHLIRPDSTVSAGIAPSANPYSGKAYVLVDAVNSSDTFDFARTVKELHLATLVGEPTGGNVQGINGGAFMFLTLPNSKIEVDVPLIGYYPAGKFPWHLRSAAASDTGVIPDFTVSSQPDDIERGFDRQLTVALRLSHHDQSADQIGRQQTSTNQKR